MSNLWKEEETSLLKELYPKVGATRLKFTLNRSVGSIRQKARSLHLQCGTRRRRWSNEENHILKELFPTKTPTNTISQKLDRTIGAVEAKAYTFGLRRPSNEWTDEEVSILKQHYPQKGGKTLAALVNRPYHSVLDKAKKLGISREYDECTQNKIVKGDATDFEMGFIVALIDGEGSITITGRKRPSPRVDIGNNNLPLLEKAQEIIGGRIYPCKTRGNRKKAYKLRLSKVKTLEATLTKLQPYFIVKRKQCDLLIELCGLRLSKSKYASWSEREVEIIGEIKKLNKRGKRL